jgi:hypothetical protein
MSATRMQTQVDESPLNRIGFDRKLCGILRDAVKDRIQFGEETRDQGRIPRVEVGRQTDGSRSV